MALGPLRLIGILGVAAVTPYIATETEFGRSAMSRVSGIFGETTSRDGERVTGVIADPVSRASSYANHAHYEVERLRDRDASRYRYSEEMARKLGAIPENRKDAPSLTGSNVPDLRAVIRFDITPDWVIGRFHRVTTVLADLSLEGLRVPIVTGTRADDIAGTLTYYFDNTGKLQRLTIHGFTGDPRRFAQTMATGYGMQRERALEAGVFTKRWNGHPVHFMRLTHAPVVYSDAVHQKFTVFLELNQPNLAYGISDEARQIMTTDHQTGRW